MGSGLQGRRNLLPGDPHAISPTAVSSAEMAQDDGRRSFFLFFKSINFSRAFLLLMIMTATMACNNEESNIQTEIKIPVSVTIIKPQSISRFIETTGTVYSSKEGSIKSELTGLYRLQTNPATGRPFALGDAVKQGQVLIRL